MPGDGHGFDGGEEMEHSGVVAGASLVFVREEGEEFVVGFGGCGVVAQLGVVVGEAV